MFVCPLCSGLENKLCRAPYSSFPAPTQSQPTSMDLICHTRWRIMTPIFVFRLHQKVFGLIKFIPSTFSCQSLELICYICFTLLFQVCTHQIQIPVIRKLMIQRILSTAFHLPTWVCVFWFNWERQETNTNDYNHTLPSESHFSSDIEKNRVSVYLKCDLSERFGQICCSFSYT